VFNELRSSQFLTNLVFHRVGRHLFGSPAGRVEEGSRVDTPDVIQGQGL
jgi:hypothetical protein